MQPVETAALLSLIALVDRRVVDEATVRHWHDLVGDLDFDDACDAVRAHRRGSTDWLQPAHVIAGVRSIRGRRLAAVPDLQLVDGLDPDDPQYFTRLRARRAAAASRHPSARLHAVTTRPDGAGA